MPGISDHITQQLSQHFDTTVQIRTQRQVFGGDINQTFQLQTNIGPFFLKLDDRNFEDMFQREFEGLQLLYQTQTIKIPEPILHGKFEKNIFLVIGFVEKGNLSKNFWQTFAHQLAALHKHSSEQFGLTAGNYIGSLKQSNNFCKTWSEFYASQRIMPLIRLAFDQNKYSKNDLLKAEKLCERFDKFFPEEKPALIHGDL